MGGLADFRAKYPQYDGLSDGALADALYNKFYSGKVDRPTFDAKLGISSVPKQGPSQPIPLPDPMRGTLPGKPLVSAARVAPVPGVGEVPEPKYDGPVEAAVKSVENVPAQFVQGAGGIEQAFGEALQQEYAPTDGKENGGSINGVNPALQQARQAAAKEGATISLRGQLHALQAGESMQPDKSRPGSMEQYFGQVMGAIAQTAPGLAASIITKNPVPALLSIGGLQYGQSYSQARTAGVDANAARVYATLQSAAEVIPETLPLHVLLEGGGGALKKVIGGAVTESATEAFTQGIQSLVDKGYLQPDMSWGDAWKQIVNAGLVGAGSGAALGVVAEGTHVGRDVVAEAAKPALDVSKQVIGGGVQFTADQLRKAGDVVRAGALSGEMSKALAGKSLQDRVNILAQQRAEQFAESAKNSAPAPTEAEGGPTPESVIAHFEGYSSKPYWDVNANRLGYGSDTVTNEDGSFRRVRPGDEVDQAAADRDLQRRINTEFIPSIKGEVGAAAWDALTPGAQAALASVTYNYGNLPDSVAAAVRKGDPEAIAEAVDHLAGANGGVNAGRRHAEAQLIRGEDVNLAPGAAASGGRARPAGGQQPAGEALPQSSVQGRLSVIQDRLDEITKTPELAKEHAPEIGRLLEEHSQIIGQQTAPQLTGEIAVPTGPRSSAATVEPVQVQPEIANDGKSAPKAGAPKSVETVTTPVGNMRVQVRPEVVDASTLQKATGELQPRDRSKLASTAQVEDIASNLNAADLMGHPNTDRGAPIVGPDGIVESGNGRIAALKRAAEAYPEKFEAYKQALRDAGYDVPAEGVPVLVRRRVSDLTPEQRIEFARNSNRDNKLAMSPAEVAALDAKGMDEGTISAFKGGAPSDPQNAGFVSGFMKNLSTEERGNLVDKHGQLNSEGNARLRRAIFAAAYGDADIIERFAETTDDNVKSITGAMADVAGEWAQMRRKIGSGELDAIDPTPHLLEAVQLLSTARNTAAERGQPIHLEIQRALDQMDLLSGEAVGAETRAYVEGFYKTDQFRQAEGRETVARWLSNITKATLSSGASMFGPADENLEERIRAAKPQAEGKTGALFSARSPAKGRADDGGSARAEKQQPQVSPDRKAAGSGEGRAVEEGEPATWEDLNKQSGTVAFNPGSRYVPNLETNMPGRQTSVETSLGPLDIPERVTKRDEARKKLLRILGDRLYQEKVKGNRRLGFYRMANSEVRIKRYDDIEVMAHEAAHFLDFDKSQGGRFTALRKRFRGELNPLSYTTEPGLQNIEGFAEYVRLWSTQYARAKALAPKFTEAFEAELKAAKLWGPMTQFQRVAHLWYYQGALAQFRGKSGESEHAADVIHRFMRQRPVDLFLQGFIDPMHGAKVIERETTGKIHSAEGSPWKLYRMSRGAESMLEAAIEDGAPTVLSDGSYGTVGKGLKDIFWPATKHGWERFDQLMEYLKARRAEELMGQGRERLFTRKEIAAGLDLGNQHPEFQKIADEYYEFNDRMLDFYEKMDLITPDMAKAFRERNKAYVPFFRVVHQVEGGADVRGNAAKIGKTLQGGQRNTREIFENIVDGLHSNIQAALTSRAKSRLFSDIMRNQAGSEFAAAIPPDSKRIEIARQEILQRIGDVLILSGRGLSVGGKVYGNQNDPAPIEAQDLEDALNNNPELAAFWQHNQTPSTVETGIESTIVNGEVKHFEVNSRLLMSLLTAPRAAPLLIRAARVPKRVLTTLVTALPQFQVPNFVRDTLEAGGLSQSGHRPFIEPLRGLKSYIANDARMKAFRVNGGMFSGRTEAMVEANKRWAQLKGPSRNGFDVVGKALSRWKTIVAATEQGTRIGEFAAATGKGVNPLEAAFRARMITGDFAQMGRNELWGWFLQTVPFANAGLRAIESFGHNMFESSNGKLFSPQSLGKFGLMAVTRAGAALTVGTVLLWLLNHNDERYKQLTVDQKARYWHVWAPWGDHYQIPKPYAVGFVFADLPEIALDYIASRDGDAAAQQLAYSVMQKFWFLDYPGVLQPFIEAAQNKSFTGAPIVPDSQQKLVGPDVIYQRTDQTPQMYIDLAKALHDKLGIDVSPIMAQHYSQGFGGYLEAMMKDGYDFLTWDKAKWGDRPFAGDVFGYFTHQFDGQEHPYRTKWTEGYYDLRARAQSKKLAYQNLFAWGRARGDMKEFTDFSENQVNAMLRSLAKQFSKIDKAFAGSADKLTMIEHDPKMSRQDKEAEINAFYDARNKELGTAYQQISGVVQQLEQGIKARPPAP